MEDARPSAAERVRTLVHSSVSATLGIPGGTSVTPQPSGLAAGTVLERAVTTEGDVLALLAADAPLARAALFAHDDELTAVMELTDIAPVAVPHRVRGRAWIAGWVTALRRVDRASCLLGEDGERLLRARAEAEAAGAGRVLLRLEVGEAHVDDLWGEEHVEPDEFAVACPDPIAVHEAELLQHLAASHGAQVRSLCALLGDARTECGARENVVPLALDRFGLRLRFTGDGRCFDARLDFPRPLNGPDDLARAMHRLFQAASA